MKCKIIYSLFVLLLVSFSTVYSQIVSGTVKDENGVPIPDVNVGVSGTSIGTTTDFDGQYQISYTDKNSVLVFTILGFETKEVEIQERSNIDIILKESSEALEEVVLVGAKVKKEDLTGSVVSIGQQTLEERPVTNINQALQGKASGVFIQNNPIPGGKTNITIRGHNSMQFEGNPIFVVDGVVMDDDFDLIDVDDISSMQVLKDASATALYGSRAANGVVVVTTKDGSSGKGRIKYKSWVGIQKYTNKKMTLNAHDFFDLRLDAFRNSHLRDEYFDEHSGASENEFVEELISSNRFADYERKTYEEGKSYNWLDEVSRKSPIQQNHSLSFSGGGELNRYFASFGYKDEEGLIKNTSNKRYSGRINAEQDITPWLKIGTKTSFTSSNIDEVDGSVFSNAILANPLMPIDRYRDTLFLAYGNSWDAYAENPINSLRIKQKRKVTKITSANYIEIEPFKDMTLRSSFSLDNVNERFYEYIPSDIQQSIREDYNGRAQHNFDHSSYYQWDNSISYETNFGAHSLNGIISSSFSKKSFDYTNVMVQGFSTDELDFHALGNATDNEHFNIGSDFTTSALQSYLGRFSYNYDQRYYLTLTTRFDGSSRFKKGHKWGFFPSMALSWNLTNERFMVNQELFNLLKLRIGYGKVGNQSIPDYAFLNKYRPLIINKMPAFIPEDMRGTPDLSWEKQSQYNVGLDIGVFNNRLSFALDYFFIKNTDLLMERDLSKLTGFSKGIENVGEIENKGFELSINGRLIEGADLNWDISANISHDDNKITRLYGGANAIYATGGFTGTDVQRTGNFLLNHSLNSIYTLEFDKIIQEEDMDYVNSVDFQGKDLKPGDMLPVDQQKEGEKGYNVINFQDWVVVGKEDPKFFGGFSTDFSWRNIALHADFTYSYGAKKISGFYERLMNGTGMDSPSHTDMLRRWTPENTNTDIPRATYDNPQRYGAGETSWGIQDASYLRLSTISLSYNFSKTIMDKLSMNSLRLYVTGSNLYTWTKYKGFDPETGDNFPMAKMFVTGVEVTF